MRTVCHDMHAQPLWFGANYIGCLFNFGQFGSEGLPEQQVFNGEHSHIHDRDMAKFEDEVWSLGNIVLLIGRFAQVSRCKTEMGQEKI